MRHPLWILNSSLLGLFLLSLLIVLLSQERTPRLASLEPMQYEATKKTMPALDIAKIYDNDLFATYRKPFEQIKQQPLEQQFPQPPMPVAVRLPEAEAPKFLEPLQISLKGIIIMGDDSRNKAIIANAKTKEEHNMRIGDKLEDSQLIRILNNRIIFIRSNGQEEIFYLREKDAKESPLAQKPDHWAVAIKKMDEGMYAVDPEAFIELVPNLSDFVNALDLTTVYRKGQPFGIRVGTLDQASFASELGISSGDIITSINQVPMTSLSNRVKMYHDIAQMPLGKHIKISLLHNGREEPVDIVLHDLEKELFLHRPTVRGSKTIQRVQEDIEKEKRELLQQKHAFAPTLDQIKRQEKRTALERVKKYEEQEKVRERPIELEI